MRRLLYTIFHPALEMVLVLNFGPPLSFSFGEDEIAEQQVERIGIIGPLRKNAQL